MECKVSEILDYDPNEGIIGEAIKSHISTEALEGELDLSRSDLLSGV